MLQENTHAKKSPLLIVGNWKMQGSRTSIQEFADRCVPCGPHHTLAIAFPFVYLDYAHSLLAVKGYTCAGQDCSRERSGPWTGQISAAMLADVGCRYVIIGHQERRLWDDDKILRGKLGQAWDQGLEPILCVDSLESAQNLVPPSWIQDQGHRLSIAYETAIGASCPSDQVPSVLKHFQDHWDCGTVRLMYGGSVNSDTVGSLVPLVQGFLVGRASWNAQDWNALIQKISVDKTL